LQALPETFRAFVAEKTPDGARVARGVRDFRATDLPPGENVVRVEWSSVNYKDALATIANGKVARISPLVPGIDLAGEVVASDDPRTPVGAKVIAHGYDLGTARHGGYTQYERVPAGWIVPLPSGMTTREAMAIGTAGFTAAMSVAALQERGLTPNDGPVLVTGASGGVGRMAIAMLARNGLEAWAVTGKQDEADRLMALGATGVLDRSVYEAGAGRAFESERWAAAIDTVGAASLPYVLRSLKYGGAVAATGNTSGGGLDTTIFPFILRGVSLIGIDSANLDILRRREIWTRLAHDLRPLNIEDMISEVTLETLDSALDAILAGEARGRWVVRVGE
jgi:putative YhdH/YhfP family quinone oxidoreductase